MLLTAALPGLAAAALPPPLPYDVDGTYHVDRWGQHGFAGHFVFPDLADGLKPYLNGPMRMTGAASGGVRLDNNGGPQIYLDDPHGSLSPRTRINPPAQNSGKDKV